MKKLAAAVVLFWCLTTSFQNIQNYNITQQSVPVQNTYKVIGVKDGDTIEVLMNGKGETVRLAHIDCPEKKQPFGNNAKQFVSDLCFGKMVVVLPQEKPDRYGRIIAEIILPDGRYLNKELVKNGLAWHFKKYSNSKEYADLEIQAKAKKVGLWSDPYAMAPWVWRKPNLRNERALQQKL